MLIKDFSKIYQKERARRRARLKLNNRNRKEDRERERLDVWRYFEKIKEKQIEGDI